MGVKFDEFDVAHGCWENYITRFSFCLQASDIEEDSKKKANLLAVCGSELFDLMLSLIAPAKISEVAFTTIVTKLNSHFHPTPNEIIESFKFHTRNQEEHEKIRDYIASLRKLSIHCNFTDLDRTLRDRLVCGIRDKEIQKKMLQHTTLKFEQACQIALSHETANLDSSLIIVAGSSKTKMDLEIPMEVNKILYKKNDKQVDKQVDKTCFRCGRQHRGECKFRWSKCNFCSKIGHIEPVCMLKSKQNGSMLRSNCNGLYETSINNVRQDRVEAFIVKVLLNGIEIEMEVDSGCAFTLISEMTARLIWKRKMPEIKEVDVALKTWTDNKLNLLGKAVVPVQYKETKKDLVVFIARGNGPSLIGRNWFEQLNIHIMGVHSIKVNMNDVTNLLKKYKNVFQEGLGKYTGPVVNITPKDGATPKFLKSRPIPFAIKERVFKEIDRLVAEDVLEPTPHSEWATPIVPVLKPNGSVRLCGDYRSTVNTVTDTDTYPLPTANEAFAELQGGVLFTKIDLKSAYTQVSVDESTSQLLTLNTPKGLYKMKRLAFGVKACPGIFQRLMSSLLAGITGVAVLLDDIVVSGTSVAQHNQKLEIVLQRLQDAGLRVNKEKCRFAAKNVEFLGFVIDELGIHPCKEKIHAIEKTPAPRNVKELQAFLGLLNFYDRFLPHKANIAEPLYRLLNKDTKWNWGKQHQEAFKKLRNMLSNEDTLVHYNLNKKLILSCDASQYGLGAVLEHQEDDGSIRPIMFASKTMNVQERNYAQVDKEAAAIVFGLKKFHQYISGRKVTIKTDHKPLLGLFDPKKPIPNIISPRMLRWALLLNSYDYSIEYVEGRKLGNADALSRWPSHDQSEEEEYSGVLLIEETPIELEFSATEVAKWTQKDTTLSKVIYWIRNGWPTKIENAYKVYWQKRDELSMFKNCILWGNRVVMPEKMRPYVLEELHRNHDGIVITKAMARSYFWWPAIDRQIEDVVKNCNICAEHRNMPPQTTHQWIRPDKAWSRLHIDYAGPFQGKTFIILIDAYSKWPVVKIVPDMSSATLIKVMREVFAEQGLPDTIVSDNGRSFISEEFKNYLNANDIRQVLVPPYHPASNGQAERTVQTIKNKLKKQSTQPWHIRLPMILYGLRTTPNSVNDKTPAELLNHRRFRTKLDRLNPLTYKNQEQLDVIERNENTKIRVFQVGDTVYVRNYSSGPRWLKGIVERKMGVCRYLVRWNGRLLTRHINQMQSSGGKDGEQENIALEKETTQTAKRNTDCREQVVKVRSFKQNNDYDDDDEEDEVIIPSPTKWAAIIGVSGPQDIAIQQGLEELPSTSGYKRPWSNSPGSPEPKRVAFGSESEEDAVTVGVEEEDSM